MPASFDGAEASVDTQRQSALDALAQFGRRGLEAAVVSQQEANKVQTDTQAANVGFGEDLRVGADGLKTLSEMNEPGRYAYARNGEQASGFLASENDAAQKVNSNYYGQVRQAVPLARTAADQLVDQYKSAFAERQAMVASQARIQQESLAQAALQTQALREKMAQDAALARLMLDSEQGLGQFGMPAYTSPISALSAPTSPLLAAARLRLTSGRNV